MFEVSLSLNAKLAQDKVELFLTIGGSDSTTESRRATIPAKEDHATGYKYPIKMHTIKMKLLGSTSLVSPIGRQQRDGAFTAFMFGALIELN